MPDDDRLDEDQDQEESDSSEGPKAGILIKILTYLIPILVSVIISVIIMFIVFKGGDSKERNEDLLSVQLQPKPEPLSYYDMGEFKINTADLDSNHFVRVSVSLGYDRLNKLLSNELAQRNVQIRDLILNLLNSKEKTQMDEFLEKEKLKEEMRRMINSILSEGEIQAVYYTEFTIS